MQIIKPSVYIRTQIFEKKVIEDLELAGRTCYKSHYLITETSAINFVSRIIEDGHHSVLEHFSISVLIICDRGVSHELVRHRLASYSQESTRYVRYENNDISFIIPCFWEDNEKMLQEWRASMLLAEARYVCLMKFGARPEQARSVLPNSTKTEIIMTCNLREWRHVLTLRCAKSAHPQMREIMLLLLQKMHKKLPIIFRDIYKMYFT